MAWAARRIVRRPRAGHDAWPRHRGALDVSRLSRGHALAHELPVLAVVGKLSLLFAVLMGVPLAFALVQDDGAASAFGASRGTS